MYMYRVQAVGRFRLLNGICACNWRTCRLLHQSVQSSPHEGAAVAHILIEVHHHKRMML